MRLVKRMGHDMQQRQRKQGKATLQDHEPHLRHRRPRQRGLDRRLCQHDQTPKERGEPANDDKHRQHAQRQQHYIRKADQ